MSNNFIKTEEINFLNFMRTIGALKKNVTDLPFFKANSDSRVTMI